MLMTRSFQIIVKKVNKNPTFLGKFPPYTVITMIISQPHTLKSMSLINYRTNINIPC